MNLFSCHRPDTEAMPPTSGTSRRGLLKGLSALLSTVGWPTNADLRAAQPQGVIAGAIRWDAWYSAVGHSLDAQKDLSPPKFHYRAPAHCKIVSELGDTLQRNSARNGRGDISCTPLLV